MAANTRVVKSERARLVGVFKWEALQPPLEFRIWQDPAGRLFAIPTEGPGEINSPYAANVELMLYPGMEQQQSAVNHALATLGGLSPADMDAATVQSLIQLHYQCQRLLPALFVKTVGRYAAENDQRVSDLHEAVRELERLVGD